MESIARLVLFALSEFRPAERLSAGASRITTAAMFSAAAVAVLAGAFVCLVASGWIALIPIVGPAGAALSAALALILVAGVLWVLARGRFPHEHKDRDDNPPAKVAGLPEGLNNLLGDNVMEEAKRLWGENKIPVLLAALVAGMALGGNDDPQDEHRAAHKH